MSDEKTTEPKSEEPEVHDEDLLGDDALKKLLKSATTARHEQAPVPDLVAAVQRKIRQRSRGKFFNDGWSTSQTRISYVLVALVMLLVIGVAYIALGPTGFSH